MRGTDYQTSNLPSTAKGKTALAEIIAVLHKFNTFTQQWMGLATLLNTKTTVPSSLTESTDFLRTVFPEQVVGKSTAKFGSGFKI